MLFPRHRHESALGRHHRTALEALEPRLLWSTTPLPSVHLTEATTLDSNSIIVDYTIAGSAVEQPMVFDVYRSSTAGLHSGSHTLLGSAAIQPADLGLGSHSQTLLPGTPLTPNPAMQYIVVVANADKAVHESAASANSAHFRILELGVIAHGFILFGHAGEPVPAWETNTAADLKKIDGYNGVIAFNWVAASFQEQPGVAVAEGNKLFDRVVDKAKTMATHVGDVVDLHFIGHSRGAVVVNQAITDLLNTTSPLPALQGSYIEETLLDPHPASSSIPNLYSAAPPTTPTQQLIITEYNAFESSDADPQIVIPKNVSAVEVYYQNSSYADFPFSTEGEYALDLWGEGPTAGIADDSPASIEWHDLSNVVDATKVPHGGRKAAAIGPIGHSEVPLWYEAHVVDAASN